MLQNQILVRVDKKEFLILEKQADELRRSRARFTDGGLKLNAFFYQTFGDLKLYKRTDAECLKTIDDLTEWQKSNPSSITARTALAWAWYGYGWFARGHGYSDSVTDENMRLFEERIDRAYDLAKEPGGAGGDCPERYDLLLRIARIRGWEDAQYDRLYQEAVSRYPDYDEFILERAVRLLSQWHGVSGEWVRFAEKSMKKAPSGDGRILYARIVSHVQTMGAVQEFKKSGVSWKVLRDGFRDMNRKYPGSSWNANRFALHACLAGDRDTIRALLGNPDFIYQSHAWPGVEIDSCRVAAGLPTMQEIAKEQMERNLRRMQEQVFNEMLGKANKGEPQAMAAVGEMYAKGDGVQKDDVKAYAWLVLSGGNKELLDEITARLSPELRDKGRREAERLKTSLTKVKNGNNGPAGN